MVTPDGEGRRLESVWPGRCPVWFDATSIRDTPVNGVGTPSFSSVARRCLRGDWWWSARKAPPGGVPSGAVAQLVERPAHNGKVGGSSPPSTTVSEAEW